MTETHPHEAPRVRLVLEVGSANAVGIGRAALAPPLEHHGALRLRRPETLHGERDAPRDRTSPALELVRKPCCREIRAVEARIDAVVARTLRMSVVHHPGHSARWRIALRETRQHPIDDLEARTRIASREIQPGMSALELVEPEHAIVAEPQQPTTLDRYGFDAIVVEKSGKGVHQACDPNDPPAIDIHDDRHDARRRAQADVLLRARDIDLEALAEEGLDERLADDLGHSSTHWNPGAGSGVDHP